MQNFEGKKVKLFRRFACKYFVQPEASGKEGKEGKITRRDAENAEVIEYERPVIPTSGGIWWSTYRNSGTDQVLLYFPCASLRLLRTLCVNSTSEPRRHKD